MVRRTTTGQIKNKITTTTKCNEVCKNVEARFEGRTLKAVFDPKNSWVVKGAETPELLAHERLHLKIAEYIAQKATAKVAGLVGKGEACNANGATAETEAKNKARNDLNKQFNDLYAKWTAIDKAATEAYDNYTGHGQCPDCQADWAMNWQNYVDAILASNGW
jgi:hypothetical protein